MDGRPLYKSGSVEVWLILVTVLNCKDSKPFAVSLYVGKGKPPSLETYKRLFLNEMKPLMEDGIIINYLHYEVEISHFACDAPARQFVKAIAEHCGYQG